jgi:hypothetical protein
VSHDGQRNEYNYSPHHSAASIVTDDSLAHRSIDMDEERESIIFPKPSRPHHGSFVSVLFHNQ